MDDADAQLRAGVLNGNIGIIKSSLAELTDHTNEARAFALLPITWTIGSSLGPLIGGALADPAQRYPYVFGDIELFREYKYLLPCLVAGACPLVGAIIGWLLLREVKRALTPTCNIAECFLIRRLYLSEVRRSKIMAHHPRKARARRSGRS